MSQRRLLALIAVALLVPLVLAAGALARKNATPAQGKAVAQAVKGSPVAGINKVPTNRYTVTNVKISTVSKAWAMASLEPTKAFRNSFQAATIVAVQPAAPANGWSWISAALRSAAGSHPTLCSPTCSGSSAANRRVRRAKASPEQTPLTHRRLRELKAR
jgi:hypothetical protein